MVKFNQPGGIWKPLPPSNSPSYIIIWVKIKTQKTKPQEKKKHNKKQQPTGITGKITLKIEKRLSIISSTQI